LILGLPLRSRASNPPTDGTVTSNKIPRKAAKKGGKKDDDDDDDDDVIEDDNKDTLVEDTEHPMEIDTPTEAKPKAPLPVFLSIDRSQRRADRGAYVFTFTQAHAVEAEEKLKFLLNYLEHHYGTSAVSHWFTQDACDRAEEVIWDNDTDRPISREELDLDELLDEELDFCDDLDDARYQFESAKISVERPQRFQQVQNNPLEGDEESVTTFYHVSDLPVLDGDSRVAEPAIGGASVAGDSHGSSADSVQ
jgi:hypothetical protein